MCSVPERGLLFGYSVLFFALLILVPTIIESVEPTDVL